MCMAATGEVRAEAEVAWRAEKKAARRTTAAAGRRATRGIARKQELALGCSGGEQRRGVARVDGRAAWHGKERPARGREGGGQGRRGRVDWCRVALRRWGARHMAGRAAAARAEKKQRMREGGR
jgi:hypothetical protein